VGLVEEVAEPHLYADMATFDALAGGTGLAGALRVATTPHVEGRVSTAVEDVVADMGSLPVLSMTRPLLRSTMVNHFQILLVLLSAGAICAIIVGGFSLGAAAGLNVLERRREIGVMRALGAAPRTVLRILLMEGAAIGVLSLVIAFLVSLPLTAEVNRVVGERGLLAVLPFELSLPALLLWAVVAAAISLLACLGPALGILRRPAREVLATD
jgi:putative ABC transport system permease protein